MPETESDLKLESCVRELCVFCDSHKLAHKDMYPKGAKKTRWDRDADELAGEGDADQEGWAEGCEEEEEKVEDEEVMPEQPEQLGDTPIPGPPKLKLPDHPVAAIVADSSIPAPSQQVAALVADSPIPNTVECKLSDHPVAAPVADSPVPDTLEYKLSDHPVAALVADSPIPSQAQWQQQLMHSNSSTSVGSAAPTLIETPSPRKAALALLPSNSVMWTPTPVSAPPRPKEVLKEVLLVVDSPLKLVKTEPSEDKEDSEAKHVAPHASGIKGAQMDRAAAMRELALLEAQLLQSQTCEACISNEMYLRCLYLLGLRAMQTPMGGCMRLNMQTSKVGTPEAETAGTLPASIYLYMCMCRLVTHCIGCMCASMVFYSIDSSINVCRLHMYTIYMCVLWSTFNHMTCLSGRKAVLDTDDTQVPTESLLDREAVRLARLTSVSLSLPGGEPPESVDVPRMDEPPASVNVPTVDDPPVPSLNCDASSCQMNICRVYVIVAVAVVEEFCWKWFVTALGNAWNLRRSQGVTS